MKVVHCAPKRTHLPLDAVVDDLCAGVVACQKAVVGRPMHTRGAAEVGIEDAGLPAKALPHLVKTTRGAIAGRFPLAEIDRIESMAAGEDVADKKQRRAAPAAGFRTNEPGAAPAEVAWRPFQPHAIVLGLPVARWRLALVAQRTIGVADRDLDRRLGLVTVGPFPS